ncbi:MAG: universal stress protein [Herbiconiux sp.]|uniref:universal stress protein n=1 Tax=Herbiconiux sp. TaxID=1871186 RepID=UPI00122AFA15|nr:universal stress protein [Herbiconiux sp.]TAJ46788.1 MAG: universal stress protein [Herbiconiux sp.]
MSDTILVGYDGSPSAKVALDWALRRAEAAGLDVDVLYVADTSWDSEAFTATPHLEQQGAVVLAEAAFHADSKAPHAQVTPRVLAGDPVAVLCAEAEATGAQMLVVGSYRKDLYERLTTSAVSLRVAAASTVPVAVIPDVSHGHRTGVVVGIDGGEASASVLAVAVAEAARLGEPLTVLSAWTLPPMTMSEFGDDTVLYDALEERAQAGVATALAHVDTSAVTVATKVVLDSPVTALLTASTDAALLVVGSHGRRGLSRFLLGSVSHDVLVHATTPTLVIRVSV